MPCTLENNAETKFGLNKTEYTCILEAHWRSGMALYILAINAMGSIPTGIKLRNNPKQVVHTYTPLPPSSGPRTVTVFGWDRMHGRKYLRG